MVPHIASVVTDRSQIILVHDVLSPLKGRYLDARGMMLEIGSSRLVTVRIAASGACDDLKPDTRSVKRRGSASGAGFGDL